MIIEDTRNARKYWLVYRAISTHLIRKAGLQLKDGATGAVTLIQRFGSALNLNIHFHILLLDGVYVYRDNRPPRFQRIKALRSAAERHAAMTWAQRLKRVFSIDIEVCSRCGGSVRVIACIEDEDIIPGEAGQALDRILAHLREKEQNIPTLPLLVPPTRAPPGALPLFAGKGAR